MSAVFVGRGCSARHKHAQGLGKYGVVRCGTLEQGFGTLRMSGFCLSLIQINREPAAKLCGTSRRHLVYWHNISIPKEAAGFNTQGSPNSQ